MPGVEEADDAHRLDKMMLVDVAFESSQLAKLATCHSVGPSTYNIFIRQLKRPQARCVIILPQLSADPKAALQILEDF